MYSEMQVTFGENFFFLQVLITMCESKVKW